MPQYVFPLLNLQSVHRGKKVMDGCECESRSRISNIHPCGLRIGHSTALPAMSTELHHASPPLAPATGTGLPEPGNANASSSSFCLAVPVVARAHSHELSADQGKDGGGVAESLARPETGRVDL